MGRDLGRDLGRHDAVARVGSALLRNRTILGIQLLPEGLRNFNYKIDFDSGEPVVLRIYRTDPSAARKEIALLEALGSSGVPVPEVLQVCEDGIEDIGPCIVTRYIEGINFRQLKRTREMDAVAEAAYSIGETLALVGTSRVYERCAESDALMREPFLKTPNAICEAIDTSLKSPVLAGRLDGLVQERLHLLASCYRDQLCELQGQIRLVHGDFGNRNVLVSRCDTGRGSGRWRAAAIIDWEFAFAGPPLFDIGSFLRYEAPGAGLREPYFSKGYMDAGGILPENWRRLAEVVDLVKQLAALADEELPDAVVAEIGGLVCRVAEEPL